MSKRVEKYRQCIEDVDTPLDSPRGLSQTAAMERLFETFTAADHEANHEAMERYWGIES